MTGTFSPLPLIGTEEWADRVRIARETDADWDKESQENHMAALDWWQSSEDEDG